MATRKQISLGEFFRSKSKELDDFNNFGLKEQNERLVKENNSLAERIFQLELKLISYTIKRARGKAGRPKQNTDENEFFGKFLSAKREHETVTGKRISTPKFYWLLVQKSGFVSRASMFKRKQQIKTFQNRLAKYRRIKTSQ